jgi:hypothetical protein
MHLKSTKQLTAKEDAMLIDKVERHKQLSCSLVIITVKTQEQPCGCGSPNTGSHDGDKSLVSKVKGKMALEFNFSNQHNQSLYLPFSIQCANLDMPTNRKATKNRKLSNTPYSTLQNILPHMFLLTVI